MVGRIERRLVRKTGFVWRLNEGLPRRPRCTALPLLELIISRWLWAGRLLEDVAN
jgi:hypothetical protein